MPKFPFPLFAIATQFPSGVMEKCRGLTPPEADIRRKFSFASEETLKAAMESCVLSACVLSLRLET